MSTKVIKKPLLPLRGTIVFPGMVTNLDVGRDKSIAAIDAAMLEDRMILLAAQKDARKSEITAEDVYEYGVLAEIKQQLTLPNGAKRILVEGLERVRLTSVRTEGEFVAEAELLQGEAIFDKDVEALRRLTIESFEKWILLTKKVNAEILQTFKSQHDSGRVADTIVVYLDLTDEKRQELLEAVNVKKRLELLYTTLQSELEISVLEKDIAKQVQQQVEKNQKEYYLREKIKAISKELGDGEDFQTEIAEYKERIGKLPLSEEIAAKMYKEVERLGKMQPMTPEGAVIRNYLDTVLDLPWGKYTEDNFDLHRAQKVLDNEHYGLKKVKERILEYLAVRALAKNSHGAILCLAGPPGVGKTSLAQSIAGALQRKFTRVSLGGVRDEAEIRGHRRTYIGALPGRIIHGMQDCKSMNPVFLLDEIDKLASDFRGDPASALLEALDPEQNDKFSDHYIEVPFDLSDVFWIVTANTTATIPAALLDRMEVIEIGSYTEEEKIQIAKRHLFPKEKKLNGLAEHKVSISEKALRHIIRDYTREAGVRSLERKLSAVCRKIAYKIVSGENKSAQVTDKNLEKYLGKIIFLDEDIVLSPEVGVCNGLAWTSIGGELLKVEVLTMPGKGTLTLTGQLGDVMKESAQAGYTYIRSREEELKLPKGFSENKDLHIHLPEGAVPKDGPSAGVTMVTAMVSALTGRRVVGSLAMTGEITLSGRVVPVGGIKEKMLAAYRYGVKKVLLPYKNMRDLDELPEKVREEMNFIPVRHLDEVLQLALED